MLRGTANQAMRNVLNGQRNRAELNAFISKDGANVEGNGLRQVEILSNSARLIAVKDNIATEHLPTTCGSRILQQYQSPFEASVVGRLRTFGSAVTGKTNMDEFGMGSHSTHSFFGSVHNDLPFNRYSVGGSSGGSAVAVATGQCQVALGTDTGGSVRLPAAYTGIVGFKPSYGLISRWGVVPYANSLDTVGILASSARSASDALHLTFAHDPRDPTSITYKSWERIKKRQREIALQAGRTGLFQNDCHGLKIGVPVEYNITELDPGVREAWQNALELLQDQGCTIVPVSLPNTRHALSAYYVIAAAEAASNLSKYDGVRYGTRSDSSDGAGDVLYSKTRGEGFGDEVKRRILLGSYTLSSEAIDNYFIKAQKVRRLVQRDFDRVFSMPNLLRPSEQFDLSDMDESVELDNKFGPSQVDFIVCPTAPTPPPTLDDVSKQTPVDTYINDVFTVPASLAGLPAISIPFKVPERFQLPETPELAGIQLIGQYADDFRLLETAIAIEQLQIESTTKKKLSGRKPRSVTYRERAFLPKKEYKNHTAEVDCSSANSSSRKDSVAQTAIREIEMGPSIHESQIIREIVPLPGRRPPKPRTFRKIRVGTNQDSTWTTESQQGVSSNVEFGTFQGSTTGHSSTGPDNLHGSQSCSKAPEIILKIRKVTLSEGLRIRAQPVFSVRKVPTLSDVPHILRYPSRKGENRLRETRTDNEVTKDIQDSFEHWEYIISGKKP